MLEEDELDVALGDFLSAPLPDVDEVPLSAVVVVDPESDDSLFVPESDDEPESDADAAAVSERLSLR